jgi:1-acyl-sn-glycerol-3-phosphate acyltransferase
MPGRDRDDDDLDPTRSRESHAGASVSFRGAVSAVARLAASEAAPVVSRAWRGFRFRAQEVVQRTLGADFEDRVHDLRLHVAQHGEDPFGLDPETARQAVKVCAFFHRLYFRTEAHGLENLPNGRVLLVANHSGQVPIDAAIIGTTLFLDVTPPRFMRAMVDRWTETLPFVPDFFSRIGQVVGDPESARRLLERDELVLSFPEGIRGISKPFSRRYQLEEFGTGFMKLAMELGVPVVPVAVIGAEEQYINVGNLDWAARALNLPAFPLLPQLLLPGGQMPLPARYRLHFGEPMRFPDEPDPRRIEQNARLVQATVQSMLDAGLHQRRSIFF